MVNNKKNIPTIYISNMSEDVWPFIQTMSSLYERESEIVENVGLAEHDLFSFSGKNNVFLVMPARISRLYNDYFNNLTGSEKIRLLSPKIHTGEICRDILSDKTLLEEIVRISKKHKIINLISYTVSPQFLNLIRFLKSQKININTPESPLESDSWVVDFYGSKSGIRQLADKFQKEEPDFKMSPGLISINIENTAKMAAKMFIKEKGIVIKTNKGHSGAGLLIFKEGDLSANYADCVDEILKYFRKEKYWNSFPIIVEKYIEAAQTIAGGYPNVEFKINKNGRVEFLYYCAVRLTDKGVFKGIEINNKVLSDQDAAEVIDIGFFLGSKLASLGYRGYFDIDFIAGKNGEIYVTESNVRRTGGTHVYYLAKLLFGPDFIYQTYTLSNNIFPIKSRETYEEKKLFEILKPVLFDKRTKEGLVITGTRLLNQNAFGEIIFARNKTRALKLEEKAIELLESAL